MDEGVVRLQAACGGLRDLDEIAKNVVVPDLERGGPGVGGIARLQAGHRLAAVVAERPEPVEFAVITGGHEAAVASGQGQFGAECRSQRGNGPVMAPECGAGFRQQRRRGIQQAGNLARERERVADGRQVARAAASEAEAREGPLDVRGAGQPPDQVAAQALFAA